MKTAQHDDPLTIRSKSPLELARLALESAREAIPPYTSRFSRHDYTQHQLYALVALRRLLRTDYRGLEGMLRDWTELREALGLVRVPDHSTIQRAERRVNPQRRKRKPARGNRTATPDQTSPAQGQAAGTAA